MIPVYEVRVWRGSLPSIFVTEDEEESIRTYEEQRIIAERQHWWMKDRVELLRNDKLIRWADEYEYAHETTLPEEIYQHIVNMGKEIMGGHMVESKTGKHLEVFIKGANGEAKKVYYLGQFD